MVIGPDQETKSKASDAPEPQGADVISPASPSSSPANAPDVDVSPQGGQQEISC
jgi:hypothetical protein